jgi:hypothetical protein
MPILETVSPVLKAESMMPPNLASSISSRIHVCKTESVCTASGVAFVSQQMTATIVLPKVAPPLRVYENDKGQLSTEARGTVSVFSSH